MTDHRDVMVALAEQHGWSRGIELGLGSGKLFLRMLKLGVRMIGVDLGNRVDRRVLIENAIHLDPALDANVKAIHWMSTSEAAKYVPDKWADFVFVDAGHSYGAVRDDIVKWLPKVRDGGWFGGHDYHPSFPGVKRAVHEAFGDKVLIHDGWIWEAKLC